MVKLSLQIKATLECIEELYTNHPNYTFFLKLKCTNCGEESSKVHDITERDTIPSKTGRSFINYSGKCKLCGREHTIEILAGTNGKYTSNDQDFKSIVTFDCRGIDITEFHPAEGWIAKAEDSGKMFEDVNLTEKEWVEYDDKTQRSVGIYDFESRFVTCT